MPTGFVPFGGGWTNLGGTILTGAAATTGVVEFTPMDLLHVSYMVTGYGGADIASLRFNADSGANYWDRHTSIAAAGTVMTNVQNASTTLIRLAAANATVQRSGLVQIMNVSGTGKVAMICNQTGSGAAATIPVVESVGGGEWVNTTQQIRSIEMRTAGGQNLNAGSGFVIFGCNLS